MVNNKVTRKDGTLEFVSYDEKVVMECQENALQNNQTLDSFSNNASTSNITGDSCSTTVTGGLFYNDVWEYDLNCTRQAEP